MLRLAVLLLLVANGLFYVWSHRLLGGWGPMSETEPHRMEEQIRPDQLQLLPRRSPASAPVPAATAPGADAGGLQTVANVTAVTAAPAGRVECLIAGIFDDVQASSLRQALAARLPAAAWALEPVLVTPARWIVYMGRYPNTEAVERKKAELRALRVRYDAPSNTALEPGLALGRFESEDAAAQELANLTRRGVRTAHVAIERAEVRGVQVRLPAVDDNVRASLDEVKVALGGKLLKPCAV